MKIKNVLYRLMIGLLLMGLGFTLMHPAGVAAQLAPLESVDDSAFGVDSVTRDNVAGLEWLDVTLSTNISYNDIITEFDPGGTFEGWRHAKADELISLFVNAGIPLASIGSGFQSSLSGPVQTLQDLVGVTVSGALNRDQTLAFIEDYGLGDGPPPAGQRYVWAVSLDLSSLDGSAGRAFLDFENQAHSALGHWLVREVTSASGVFIDSGQALSSSLNYGLDPGDVDGDGDLDAFVANYNQPNKVWLNNGTGTFTDSGQALGSSTSNDLALGDLDGDGDLDAFVANNGQPNKVWLNNGTGTFTDSGQAMGNSPSYDLALGDVDGDGDLDAFVANSGQPNKVWLNNSTGSFTDSGQALGSSLSFDLALGDMDGDGDLDAFVANSGHSSKVWLNNGTGTFTDSGQSLGSSYSNDLAFGDVDGDGGLDAFVANNSQSKKVWLNTSTALTGPDGDGDALTDNFEDGFGGTGIDVQAPEPVSSTGDASTGSTISAGDFRLSSPPGTEADTPTTEIEIRFEQDATGDGAPAVQISGVSLPAGLTKTVQMPFGNQTAVCIADVPDATIETLTAGECVLPNIEVRIPEDGGTNHRSGYTVARLGDTATISGLANTSVLAITGLNTNGVEGLVDFEDFGPDDQSKRFGVDLDENYAGLNWAYPPTSSKINTWGSFTVQDATAPGGNDSEGDSIPGAGFSDNWLKVRASSVGKGAKITRSAGECFEFESMNLFTQDHPVFIDEVTVTWRTCDAATTDSANLSLADDTWIPVTAGNLGIEGVLLRAMWFNGAQSNPNAAKFGLDDFEVYIVPEP